MRFTCPSCQTVYDIPDGKVQSAPKMRCKVCRHVWKITPPTEQEHVQNEEHGTESSPSFEENLFEQEMPATIDPFASDMPDGDFSKFTPPPKYENEEPPASLDNFLETPFFEEESRTQSHNIRAAFCFLFVGLGLFAAGIAVRLLNKNPPPPVGFENVTYYFSEEEYKRFLIVSGKLINKTDEPASVPMFYVRFFNKGNVNIANQSIPVVIPVLQPDGAQTFTLRIERPPASAERIELILKDVALLPPETPPADAPAAEQTAAPTEKDADAAPVQQPTVPDKTETVTPTTANPTDSPAFLPTSAPAE